MSNEQQIQELIESWAGAVRQKDIEGILANHSKDIVMYDVPPPFKSVGLEEYKKTWATFYEWTRDEVVFDIVNLKVVAGKDVAFGFTDMKCAGYTDGANREPLNFRLTVGLQKTDGHWLIVHEHHSIPAE